MLRSSSYVPTVGPWLRVLLGVVFLGVAILGASGAYLTAIRVQESLGSQTVTNSFTLWVLLAHIVVGVFFAIPFLLFGIVHWRGAKQRTNRKAIRRGLGVMGLGVVVVATGFGLIQLDGMLQLQSGTLARSVTLVIHGLAPLAAVALYIAHRKAGPKLRWKWGVGWSAGVGSFVLVAVILHAQDPRLWVAAGPREGERYFHPAATRTTTGNFIPADTLMMDQYCLQCHPDAYNSWVHSAHRFSSFSNPAYLFSVRETRKVAKERDGNVQASRWCAGCHDPVPFLSGAFDDPNFDDEHHPTASAGVTCTVCHAVTHINGPIGNGAYTLDEPLHYPFARSQEPILRWVNRQLVRAKPEFHKRTFLKPLHKTAEFCSVCHKVSLPPELNHYKEFLRGQNHYDSFLLSGVSGHGARGFYFPDRAKENCSACHMPLLPSNDPAARNFDATGRKTVHDHLFPGSNTGLPTLLSLDPKHVGSADGFRDAARRHAEFLRGTALDGSDRKLRVDIFGVKEDGRVDGKLHAPLRPNLPHLNAGRRYLVEVVIRTLGVGHHFTQGTVDSNEVWVEFLATSAGKVIGQSGGLRGPGDAGPLDDWAHRVNVLLLDRNGNRINRRNPQDIFTPLYDKQIPPGAAQVVHYDLQLPSDVNGPIELSARVRYRKFDHEYMALVHPGKPVPVLPIVDLCEDRVTLPIGDGSKVPIQESPVKPAWQRWNDYGIGCLLEGGLGAKRGELRQAEAAFREVAKSPVAAGHGHLNCARVLIEEGRLAEAVVELQAARMADPPAPWWLLAWFTGIVTAENASGPNDLDAAAACFEKILDPGNQPFDRGFDFSRDYVVRNRLADVLFKRSLAMPIGAEREKFLLRAIQEYRRTLREDPEDLDAHFGLSQCFARLRDPTGVGNPAVTSKPELGLVKSARVLNDRNTPVADRLTAAAGIVSGVRELIAKPLDPTHPRLPVLKELLGGIDTIPEDPDPVVRSAGCEALSVIHRAIHTLLRPDENARSRAVTTYRKSHPAANLAAESVVIYPLQAPGTQEGGRR